MKSKKEENINAVGEFCLNEIETGQGHNRVAADAEVPVSVRKKAPVSWSSHIST